ncbi:MAG TPA: CoA ester lyase [Aliidongia sp.]|nr:CoA ester lyase [Aliidongia sp.]
MERSWLFVPGDSERKMTKAATSGADVLILDLEDSVAAENLATARGLVREYLKSRPDRSAQKLWVRINPLATPMALADLAGVMPGGPDGILLPKPETAAEVVTLGHYLDAFETAFDLGAGRTRIMPVATETALGMFQLGAYRGLTPRLAGLTWGAEDLAAALGAGTNRGADGAYSHTYEMARSLCLLGAVAAGVPPIDTITGDFRDKDLIERETQDGRRLGFRGKIAIHPDQVEIINRAFTPTEAELDWARRVVAAFAKAGTGTVGLDGQMLDMPHLKQAQNLLAQAGPLGK